MKIQSIFNKQSCVNELIKAINSLDGCENQTIIDRTKDQIEYLMRILNTYTNQIE